MVVYQIVNTENQKRYIGSTQMKLNLRWNIHKECMKNNGGNKLYEDMRQIGIDKFKLEVIDEYGGKETEEAMIQRYNTIRDGYNVRRAFVSKEQKAENQRAISKRRYEAHRDEIKAKNLARYYELSRRKRRESALT